MSLLPTVYAIVTNDMKCSSYEGMLFYEQRGASENFTKELKNDFDAGHLSHSDFFENEMEWLISSMAYNLFHLFQNTILTGSDKTITMNTFRLQFQKIAVKITSHARKLVLSFSSAYNNRRRFMNYWNLVLPDLIIDSILISAAVAAVQFLRASAAVLLIPSYFRRETV